MSSPAVKRFRPFVDLHLLGDGGDLLPGRDDLDMLLPDRGTPHLLFGRYGAAEIAEASRRWGIAAAREAQGLTDVRINIEASVRGRQVCRVLLRPHDLLVTEMILSEGRFRPSDAIPRRFPEDTELLVIQWICMQNPLRAFTPDRPPLPGQAHPGFGAGRNVMEMLLALAGRLEVDGIVNRPEFLHNALLYEPYFLFLHPETQGRYDALVRDLGSLPLLELAWGGHRGAIVDEAAGTDFEWVHSEQMRPAGRRLARYFGSREYTTRRVEAARTARFSMDRRRLTTIMDQVRRLETGVDG